MNISSVITSIVKLPLTVVGRLLGSVTGGTSSPETVTAPPTDMTADAASPVAKKAPAAKKTAPKKASAAEKTAPKVPAPTPTSVVEPMPSSGTAIDAAAEDEEVDVTPADLAKVMGTQLGEDSSSTS